MLKPIPSFIYSRANQIFMILFVPFFALVFINIYRPLDLYNTENNFLINRGISPEMSSQLIALMLVASGMAIATISRLIMRVYVKRHTMTYIGYIVWILGEIGTMATVYTLAALVIGSDRSTPELFRNSFVKTSLIVVIPYVVCYIYFIWQERVKELKTIRKRLEEDENILQKAYIQIFDEKGKMQLSVRREHLLVIESADNYVCVWYMNGEAIRKVMVRTTLKQVAEQLQESNILRCHRSYIINLDCVRVLRREKEGIFVEFGIEGLPDIPISKTYAENITRWLMAEQRG